MDAAAGLGRNPVSKHQIQPEYGVSRLTRDGMAEPVSRDQILRHARGQAFPVQLTTSRIGSLTRLIHTLLYVMTIHTYIYIYILLLCTWYVFVVVDSHVQRIVLATEETTVTQQVSHRPIKCQSRLWSQKSTKVNESHHGDNPLLRPTGIQIATKSYATLQAMAPTNTKTVHQTSFLHIESNLD